jgi:hypothetical protein
MNLFGTKKTTASVMASFQQTLNDLEQVHREHSEEAEQHRIAAEESAAAHAAALNEANNARSVAGRIKALLGTDEGIGLALNASVGGA